MLHNIHPKPDVSESAALILTLVALAGLLIGVLVVVLTS